MPIRFGREHAGVRRFDRRQRTQALEHDRDRSCEFRRLVRNGLGRVVLHLQRSDPGPFVTTILEACRTNDCYDRQVNEDRTDFYWDLIDAAGGSTQQTLVFLIEEFATDPEPPSWLVSLVQRFAAARFPQALPFLKSALDRDPVEPRCCPGTSRPRGTRQHPAHRAGNLAIPSR